MPDARLDRTRAAYMTTETTVRQEPRTNALILQTLITQRELASWPSPEYVARAFARRTYDQVIALFK